MYHASNVHPRSYPDFPVAAPPEVPPSLHSLQFSTEDIGAADQFDAWRHVNSAALDLFPNEGSRTFHARHQTWDLGGMAFQTTEADGLRFASLAGQVKRDPVDHWVVAIFVTGSCAIEGTRDCLENTAGIPQLTSLADQFRGQVTHSKTHLLYIPRNTCRDTAHLLDAASMTLLRGGMGGIFADYMLSLECRIAQLEPDVLPEFVAATRALLLAAISPSQERLQEARVLINQALLERARQFVQDNLQNPELDVRLIIRSLGVSRSRLYRLFEPSGGIIHHIQKRRLLAAHKVLAEPLSRRRICEVADDFCFNDAADFSRAFRREFGYSPSDVRASGITKIDDQYVSVHQAKDLSDLLRRL